MQITYQRQKKPEAEAFNLTFRYISDALSINNLHFANWIPSIYPKALEIKQTTETALSLPHFLIFTSNLRPMVNFLPNVMTKQTT
jgi:hypothetical protein